MVRIKMRPPPNVVNTNDHTTDTKVQIGIDVNVNQYVTIETKIHTEPPL